ncbi:MAG: methionyl-tRNA formyltransferase, partial [Polaribacter sp.]
TGVTTFFIDDKIDTGEIILQKEIEIDDNEIVGSLHDKLMYLGADLVNETVKLIQNDKVSTYKQPELEEKSAYKLNPDNCKIDWCAPIDTIYNKIRGLNPFPAAWTTIYNNDEEIAAKIYAIQKEVIAHTDTIGSIISSKRTLKVAVQNGYIIIDEIKLAGKRKMDAKNLLNGYHFSEDSKML